MYTMGIDVGSSSSKAVVLRDGREVTASAVVQAGTGSSGPGRVLEAIAAESGLGLEDMSFILATGYGRTALPMAHKQMSEIICHARGVFFQNPEARTLIDIGGQDVKAIALDDRGNVRQFYMNDKCAAGTGRFLEVMSRVLEVSMEDMAVLHFRSRDPAPVSSTCTVFAESEVISLLSRGTAKEDIIAGVHFSVAAKACALAQRVGVRREVVLCGGAARNSGVADAIQKELGQRLVVAQNPQLTGALGAALLAYEEMMRKERSA